MEFLSFSRDEIVHGNFISEAFKTYLANDFEDQQNKFTFIFGDQRTIEFVGILKVFSPLLNSILKDCPLSESKSIIVPDFCLGSFQHLCHLLATGVTKVQDQADVVGVKSLAQCFNINMEKLSLTPGVKVSDISHGYSNVSKIQNDSFLAESIEEDSQEYNKSVFQNNDVHIDQTQWEELNNNDSDDLEESPAFGNTFGKEIKDSSNKKSEHWIKTESN